MPEAVAHDRAKPMREESPMSRRYHADIHLVPSRQRGVGGNAQRVRRAAAAAAAAILAAALTACAADQPAAPSGAAADVYTYRPAARDGIGKVYQGREISFVMGHLGAGWLERSEREREERTDLLLQNLPLEPDDVVADIGAGTGYFSLPIAGRVPQGRVLAVDLQPEMLAIVASRAKSRGIANVEPVQATETDPRLPPGTVDLVLMVDAYHEFSHPYEVMQGVVRGLKPGGRVVLVEYRAEDPEVPILTLHKMSEAQARKEMKAVGLEWVETRDFLPQQHYMVFRKPAAN
jgi:SAM-dependent methyltransferase